MNKNRLLTYLNSKFNLGTPIAQDGAHLGEDYKIDAEEKFKKVQEAYDNIKKQRGIN